MQSTATRVTLLFVIWVLSVQADTLLFRDDFESDATFPNANWLYFPGVSTGAYIGLITLSTQPSKS